MKYIIGFLFWLIVAFIMSACESTSTNEIVEDEDPIVSRQVPICYIKEGTPKTDERITVKIVCKDGDISIDRATVTLDGVLKNLDYSGASINDYIGFDNLRSNTKYTAEYMVIVGGETLTGSIDIRTKKVSVIVPSSIVHNGRTYDSITSPHTGKVWLDRNLGATQVCTAFNDVTCYGDYYQWGRNFDGHEDSASSNFNVPANNINNVGHGNFIVNTVAPYDWATIDISGALRVLNWSSINGNSVCPTGFRVPTILELRAETIDTVTIGGSTHVTNNITAFTNFLKIPSSGFRIGNSLPTTVQNTGIRSDLWTVSLNGALSVRMEFNAGAAIANNFGARSYGRSVRCIKN